MHHIDSRTSALSRSPLILAICAQLLTLLAACGGADTGTGQSLTLEVSADVTSVEVGHTVALTAAVEGPGADADAVRWSAEEGTFSSATGSETSWTTPSDAGRYTITGALSAGDRSATDTVVIDVAPASEEPADPADPGDPQPLAVKVHAPARVHYGQEVELRAELEGEGSEHAEVLWEVSHGALSDDRGLTTVWTAPDIDWHVRVAVRVEGHTAMDSQLVSVGLCTAGDRNDEADPCVISNLVQLQGIGRYPVGHFALGGDIDAAETALWNDGGGFQPLGTGEVTRPFGGTFDGRDHEIRGLYVNRPDMEYVGLFARVRGDSSVRNVHLVDSTVMGGKLTGGLVGENRGEISGASTHGRVEGMTYTGGLVGDNHGPVRGSTSTAEVRYRAELGETSSMVVGGLVGGNGRRGLISGSSSSNPVVENLAGGDGGSTGGLVGINWGVIEDSYSSSVVRSNLPRAGGLVGNNQAPEEGTGIIRRSFTTQSSEVSGTWYVGGLVGHSQGLVEHSYSFANPVSGTNQVGGLIGILSDVRVDEFEHAGRVEESYSMSGVKGSGFTGGLIGEAGPEATVLRSYWDVQRSGQDSSAGGGTGVGTLGFFYESTFDDWAFGDVWTIDDGADTPDLIANPRPLDPPADPE